MFTEQVAFGCACPGRLGGDPIPCVSFPRLSVLWVEMDSVISASGGPPSPLTAGDHAGGDEDLGSARPVSPGEWTDRVPAWNGPSWTSIFEGSLDRC